MRFNLKALALTCASFCSGLFVLCAAAIWLAPQLTLSFFNLFLHGISLKPIYNPNVGLLNFLTGLILTFTLSAAGSIVWGFLYNKLDQERQ